ncbi:PRP1 splicing factor, N-terminal-domain-containing protein [Kickxella alabastrina]|uniref:PRP1 splicing factor, N-terminal-domain-containing protein n=1 Tax=Kickxella alabastrina TaxID=61397 RepID=UPI00221E6E1C|nr:PRP1 splicing factor, N-terminal-domain-containing protein [Kickxella alabastrina]KAI7826251.1 PRP1 splicing factor, N-terminal-domain-containing protein [Kickxella alabastrina]
MWHKGRQIPGESRCVEECISVQAAPPGYVAGLGRGASGFTTRSDIGPAREAAAATATATAGATAAGDSSSRARGTKASLAASVDARFQDAENEEGLFSNMRYEADDEEADRVWAQIDAQMEQRHAGKRKSPHGTALRGTCRIRPHAGFGARARRPDQAIDAAGGGATDLLAIGQARDSGYLTSLGSLGAARAAEVGDIGRARELLRSVTAANPTSAPGWLARARVEEMAGEQARARKVILEACEREDVWVEAARLHATAEARAILASGVRHCPQSVRLWSAAADLEIGQARRRVLRRALEKVPGSQALWMDALETRENARRVLNRARRAVPASADVWVAAARLEEQHQGGSAVLLRVMAKAVAALAQTVDRAGWLQLAVQSAADGYPGTCGAIVRAASAAGFDADDAPEDRARALAAEADAAEHGAGAGLADLLERATRSCPGAEVLWLMAAKHAWAAQGSVAHALRRRPRPLGTARIWMKSAVLLRQAGRPEEALALCRDALARFPQCPKLWLVCAQLEAQGGRMRDAQATLSRALKLCPTAVALWTQAAGMAAAADQPTRARAILERARVHVPRSAALWLQAVRLEARALGAPVARTTLARALQECPHAACLWAEGIVLADRAQRKARSVDALKNAAGGGVEVVVMVARLFWAEGKVEKARAWFARACVQDADHGDAWAWRWRFEQASGGGVGVGAVEAECARAEPRHGEVWPRVAKAPENAHLTTAEVLRKAAAALSSLPQLQQ